MRTHERERERDREAEWMQCCCYGKSSNLSNQSMLLWFHCFKCASADRSVVGLVLNKVKWPMFTFKSIKILKNCIALHFNGRILICKFHRNAQTFQFRLMRVYANFRHWPTQCQIQSRIHFFSPHFTAVLYLTFAAPLLSFIAIKQFLQFPNVNYLNRSKTKCPLQRRSKL